MTNDLREFLSREFQTVEQVAKFATVSKGIVYAAIEREELPARKLTPRLFRVRTADALAWLGVPVSAPESSSQSAGEDK